LLGGTQQAPVCIKYTSARAARADIDANESLAHCSLVPVFGARSYQQVLPPSAGRKEAPIGSTGPITAPRHAPEDSPPAWHGFGPRSHMNGLARYDRGSGQQP